MAGKYPELQAMLDRLSAEKTALQAQSAPLREQRDMITAQIQPLEAMHRELTTHIRAIELPRMAEIDAQLSALARAMGGRRMSDAPTADAEKAGE